MNVPDFARLFQSVIAFSVCIVEKWMHGLYAYRQVLLTDLLHISTVSFPSYDNCHTALKKRAETDHVYI